MTYSRAAVEQITMSAWASSAGRAGEVERLALDPAGKLFGGFNRAIRDEDARCARARQMLRGEFGHFARADDEHGRALERAENFASEFDRRETDRDGGGRNARLRPHTFGDAQRMMDEAVQHAPGCARRDRVRVGATHLTEHLRFADQHRIERGSDAEEMAHGLRVRV
jgi:hypothetical protein